MLLDEARELLALEAAAIHQALHAAAQALEVALGQVVVDADRRDARIHRDGLQAQRLDQAEAVVIGDERHVVAAIGEGAQSRRERSTCPGAGEEKAKMRAMSLRGRER